MRVRLFGILCGTLLAGCSITGPYCDRACVSTRVEGRTGHFLGPAPHGGLSIPDEMAALLSGFVPRVPDDDGGEGDGGGGSDQGRGAKG